MQSTEILRFVIPEIIQGWGARTYVGQVASAYGARRWLLVTDAGVIEAGWLDEIAANLDAANQAYTVFSEVTPNPRAEAVREGAACFSEAGCDAILSIGGGSPTDCAKGIGIVASNGGDILDYEGVDRVPMPSPPMVCIPTTAGTGADVSQFAIITDTASNRKVAIIGKTLVPDVSIVDPETTITMGPELTANTGMDALSHAIESIASNAANSLTRIHALEASALVFNNLREAYRDGASRKHREAMMSASLHAGLAFSNSSLGVVHAMAHSLGGVHDLAHGMCNAILLAMAVDFNYATAAPQYASVVEHCGLAPGGTPANGEKGVLLEAIRALGRDLCIREGLSAAGVQRDMIPCLAKAALGDPCLLTNPREVTLEDLEALYGQVL